MSSLKGVRKKFWLHTINTAMLLWWHLFGLIESGNILSQHVDIYLLVYHAFEQDGTRLTQRKFHQNRGYSFMYSILRQHSTITQALASLINIVVAASSVLIWRKVVNTQLVSAVEPFTLGNASFCFLVVFWCYQLYQKGVPKSILYSYFAIFQSTRRSPTLEHHGVITALYLVTIDIEILFVVDKSIYLLIFYNPIQG